MTKVNGRKRHKLSGEILGVLAITVVIALLQFHLLSIAAGAIVDSVLFMQDIVLTQAQYKQVDDWIFNLSLLASVGFFVVLFLFLLGERLSYIRDILEGIDALQKGKEDHVVPVEGNNELTRLAQSVNYLARTQREVKEQEQALAMEKEQFLRGLSHDIRTPLTSIMAYSELLAGQNDIAREERVRYLDLIHAKAGQIKEMTDLLLDGSKRSPEHFENAYLLMEQLADEFESVLEDDFSVKTTLAGPTFSATFDVQELQRIFDNLISNVQKYAAPDKPVLLSISAENGQIIIRQENSVRRPDTPTEGYQIGLKSIRRIAQNYGGRVEIQRDDTVFVIRIILSEI